MRMSNFSLLLRRSSLAAGPHFFREEELLNRMRKYLVSRDWSAFDAEALEEKLRVADYSLNPRKHVPDLPKDWSVTDWSAAAPPSEDG